MTPETERPLIEKYPGFPQLEALDPDQFPQHVLIIPDGNRTWARERGLSQMEGHMAGLQNTLELLRATRKLPIKRVSLWAFSNENNRRTPEEKNNLMELFTYGLKQHTPELVAENARLEVIGNLQALPENIQQAFNESVDLTRDNTGQIVTLLVNFSGADQDMRMHRKTAKRVIDLMRANPNIPDEILIKSVTQGWVEGARDGGGNIPPADLIFRTKESRTSGIGWYNGDSTILRFLPEKLFPDLTKDDLAEGILFYSKATHNRGA